MPRKNLVRSDCFPYHVTARTNNKESFRLNGRELWNVVGSECLALSLIYGVEFHGLVLMPNHLHMLLTVPEHDLGAVMNVFMSNVTRVSNRLTGCSGHLFGGPYFWSMICSSRYYGHALKYVYRNPVRAGLCERVEQHNFSTVRGLCGYDHLPFPLHYTKIALEAALPMKDHENFLGWLNEPFPKEAEKLIQTGLRRKKFEKILRRKDRRLDLLAGLL